MSSENITNRFSNLFRKVENLNFTTNTTMNVEKSARPAFIYRAPDVSIRYDFVNKLVPIPKKSELKELDNFLNAWEKHHQDKRTLVLNQYKDSMLFEWILFDIFEKKGFTINTIVSERCKYTMAFGGKTIIEAPDYEICIKLVAILMELQDECHQFDIARLTENIEFPPTYSMFPIEYSLSLAQVNIFYLPFQEPQMVLFAKPRFCLQYHLLPVPGYVLGEHEPIDQKLMYQWDFSESRFELYRQPNGDTINVTKAGKIAMDYHQYQQYYLDHIIQAFRIDSRQEISYQEIKDNSDLARKFNVIMKFTNWAEKWLYLDFGIMTNFSKKESFKDTYRQYQSRPNRSNKRTNYGTRYNQT